MAEGLSELAGDISDHTEKLQVALEDGDIDGAREEMKKIRGRLDELETGLNELGD